MAETADAAEHRTLGDRLRGVLWGRTDTRVRATWRVLLAWPLLWVLTGGVLTGNLQSALAVLPSGGARLGGLTQSVLHAGFFLAALAVWARYLDRDSLANYGVSVEREWGVAFLVGSVAVLGGFAAWLGVGALLGTTTIAVSPSLPQGSVVYGLVVPFVAFVLHAAVQQVVFFRVVLGTAAEGLHSRGLAGVHAAAAAVPVAVLLFVLMHGDVSALRALDLVVAGGIFALLSLQTGSLALGIGAHFAALYAGIVMGALLETSGSLPGVLGVANQYGFPKMVVAYALVVGWLTWRHGTVGLHDDVIERR